MWHSYEHTMCVSMLVQHTVCTSKGIIPRRNLTSDYSTLALACPPSLPTRKQSWGLSIFSWTMLMVIATLHEKGTGKRHANQSSEVKFRPLLSDLTMRRAGMRRRHLVFSALPLQVNELDKRHGKISCPEALGWCEATDIYPTSETQLHYSIRVRWLDVAGRVRNVSSAGRYAGNGGRLNFGEPRVGVRPWTCTPLRRHGSICQQGKWLQDERCDFGNDGHSLENGGRANSGDPMAGVRRWTCTTSGTQLYFSIKVIGYGAKLIVTWSSIW